MIFSRIAFGGLAFFIYFSSLSASATISDSIRNLLKASYHLSQQYPDSSRWAVTKAIELAEKIQNDTLLADSYLEMSYVKSESGNSSAASLFAFKAIQLYEKLQLPNGMAKGFCRVAWIKLETGTHDDVLEDLYQALDLAKQDVDSTVLSTVYHMLGLAYNWINKYGMKKHMPAYRDSFNMWLDSSIYYNKKAVAARRKLKVRGLPNSLNNLGMVLLKSARETKTGYNAVDSIYQEVLKIRLRRNDYPGISASYTNLAQLERYQGNYAQALRYAQQGRILAEKMNYPFHLRLNYNELSKIHEAMGNLDSALFYTRKYYKMQLMAASEKNKNAIKELETRYEVSKKDAALNLQQQKLRLQQSYLWFALAGIAIMVFASIIFFRLYHKNKILSNRNTHLMREQNHRIKNNLQIISGLLSLQANRTYDHASRDVIEASQARVEAMSLIHKKLYTNSLSLIQVDEFIAELTHQVLLAAGARLQKKDLQLSRIKLKADTVTSLGLIVNELLINSCKYAFPIINQPELYLHLETMTDDRIMLTYHDNGPGFNFKKALAKPQSLGLKLIHIQVEQLRGKYEWSCNGNMMFKVIF